MTQCIENGMKNSRNGQSGMSVRYMMFTITAVMCVGVSFLSYWLVAGSNH